MRRARGAAWPLVALSAGMPLWWVLGLAELIFFLLAVPMVLRLMTIRPLRTPPWFGLWLAFLAVVLFSGPLMVAHAPGTLDATLSTGLLTFAYRLALYVVATVFLLYVVNLSERELPTAIVGEVLAGLFIVTVAGGLLGVAVPGFEFTSPVERLLPGGTNEFVRTLVHPAASDVETILGYPEARPKAPYLYANSWGANFTVTLPFFLWRYAGRGAAAWRRLLVLPVLAAGAVGVTYSLNRGLWIGIGLAAAVYAVHLVRQRGARILPGVVIAGALAIVVVLVSPLSSVITQRLESPHSNQRRGDMAAVTVSAVAQGSPVLGYGNTRKLAGSFASIAGGATDDCPFCAVPPLGTQGHFWLLLFTNGFLGLGLFFAFLLAGIARSLRRRDAVAVAGLAALVPLLFEMLAYDTLGLPFILGLLIFGLLARTDPEPRLARLEQLSVAVRAGWPRVLGGAVVGLLLGLSLLPQQTIYEATADVLVPNNPVYLSTGQRTPRSVTVDTEARTALAAPVLDRVRREARAPEAEFSVAAVPTSRVLLLTATGPDREAVRRAADRLADEVVRNQRERLRSQRRAVIDGADDRIRALTAAQRGTRGASRGVYSGLIAARLFERERIASTLLVDARQLRSAQVSRADDRNRLVPPLSGLAVGVLLGCLGAVLRPRTLEPDALHRLAPGVLVLGPRDRHAGGLLRTVLADRHGPGATVCVVTVAANPRDVRWLRRTLADGGIAAEFDSSARTGTAAQAERALAHDAVVLVLGRRPEEDHVHRTLDLLASVGRFPDVIMAGAVRLMARPTAPVPPSRRTHLEEPHVLNR